MEKMVNKSFFYKKKILITGNTGFLGSWLTLFLLNKGASITGVSNSTNKDNLFKILNLKKKINYFHFNLKNEKKIQLFFKKKKFDIIIHLAAEPLVFKSFNFPKETIENNFLTTLKILKYVNNKKTKLFLNFTSDKVYKNLDKKNLSYKENSELFGSDPYSFSKSCSDMLVKMWSDNFKTSNIKYINVRCGNIIGGADWNEKRIVTDIIGCLFKNKKLALRNPKSTRPWIHVYEVCNYLLELIKNNKRVKDKYSAWNIGPDKSDNKNVKWITTSFFKQHGKKIKSIKYEKSKFKEKIYLNIDNSKINKFLIKKLRFRIEKRIQLTYEWYKEFFHNREQIAKYTINQINKFII
jgi:CDP-glucose 4,6-dehydratase